MISTSPISLVKSLLRATLLTGISAGVLVGHVAVAEDSVSKFLLIKLSREQSQVLCKSEEFTACMEFTEKTCFELSEKALQQCIVPLPDTISLAKLSNKTLEDCPQKVYSEAGYSEEKAKDCITGILGQ